MKIEDWADTLEPWDVTEVDIENSMRLLQERQNGRYSVNDAVWSIYNQLIAKYPGSPQDLRMIYWEMAGLVRSEGRDGNQYAEQANRWQLIEYLESGFIEFVTIQSANDDHVCEACTKLIGRKYPLQQELDNMQIPHKCTNTDGCRCGYSMYYVR